MDAPDSLLEIENLEPLLPEPLPPDTRQKFLRLQLSLENTALLPVDQIAAVVTVVITDIVPVPQMPECVLGIYNWRGEMLWLVDLGCQVGFPSLTVTGTGLSRVMMIVAQVKGRSLGLVVSQIHDIELHEPEQLQPPSAGLFAPRLLPFVQSYLTQDRSLVLNPAALLQDSSLQVHQLN